MKRSMEAMEGIRQLRITDDSQLLKFHGQRNITDILLDIESVTGIWRDDILPSLLRQPHFYDELHGSTTETRLFPLASTRQSETER